MKEKKVTIPTNSGELATTITLPKAKKTKGIIIFVHGDGPQNATQSGGYFPLMERFSKEGYMSVSWDKLGVGNSTGNWLIQSMEDRQNEVKEVISWLKKEYPNETQIIGLWGASQAGWVIPSVLNNSENNISFAILAAPAINWVEQGKYDTFWQAKKRGDTDEVAKKAVNKFEKEVSLININKTYIDYRKSGGTEELSDDRYDFIRKNINEDITKTLTNIDKPLLLILADNDKNIDSNETERVYSREVDSSFLTIKRIPNVEHQMINPMVAHSDILINIIGFLLPKYFLIDQTYLNNCSEFISNFSL